jgi:hypothetical protein
MAKARKPKLSRVERLLQAARRNPSSTCHDARQRDIIEFINNRDKLQASTRLDQAIPQVLKDA